jgi:ribA/ribD-fused uncharacterized protein
MGFTSLDAENKCSETESHFFFLNGPFSQWFPCQFISCFEQGGEELTFNCAEQYMMAAKALLFSDTDTYDQIMATEQRRNWHDAPKKQKALGRAVRGFDQALWAGHARDVAFRGNWAKFGQNPALALYLEKSADKIIVEGAHYDQVWGVGLSWDDERIVDPANWLGTNWLGQALMKVRTIRRKMELSDGGTSPTGDQFGFNL